MKKYFNFFFIALMMFSVLTACANDADAQDTPNTPKGAWSTTLNADGGINYLILINKDNKLPDDWEANVQLETAKDLSGMEILVEAETLKSYLKLREALIDDGINIELDSAYRSVIEQKELRDYYTRDFGEAYVENYVAVPGYSEHHTGLAIDICFIKDGKIIDDNESMLAERETFSCIFEKIADYGFIVRYPEGKESITGYSYEPWHLRYVGSIQVAKEMAESELTLEEYLIR